MPTSNAVSHDVIIAGAGAVGLFLACELRLGGVSVLVLEQAPDPRSALKNLPFGLRGLSVPTIDSFDRRNLLDALQQSAAERDMPTGTHWMQQKRRPGGHFAGIQFFDDRIDIKRWSYRLPGPVDSIAADMANIETLLALRAVALGVDIRRGCAVEAIETADDGIIVRAGGDSFEGSWLVGCDGGRSTVRKAAGIGFTGTDPEFTGYSVQAVLGGPDLLTPGRHYTPAGMYTYAQPGTIAMVDFDSGAFHRSEPTRNHIETVLRKISGADVTVTELELATTWTDRAHQAVDYRKGRVLLAGDAAHVHSPLGGQGLNLGFGDAMNLGWKLAATIRGDAPDDLLETYTSERHHVAAEVLDWSRAQVAIMRPSAGSRALEAIIRDLIETPEGATYFAERVWGVGLRYDLGDDHPLVGRSVPDFKLSDGSRTNEKMRDGRGLLLDFGKDGPLAPLASHWANRIIHVTADVDKRLSVSAVLVRPDGIVAWASDGAPDLDQVAQVATRWFGTPERATLGES